MCYNDSSLGSSMPTGIGRGFGYTVLFFAFGAALRLHIYIKKPRRLHDRFGFPHDAAVNESNNSKCLQGEYAHMNACMHAHAHTCIYVCMYAGMQACMRASM